ncbi:MAG: RING finger domain-containing protein [Promethearchaeota archaeon]
MSDKVYNFCPYCGKRLPHHNKNSRNFCCYCGVKLKKENTELIRKVQCTICHKIVDSNRHQVINCSFCGSMYHTSCVSTWLAKYNACPMCQNVFLFPNKILPLSNY